jgi:hypothetical protein
VKPRVSTDSDPHEERRPRSFIASVQVLLSVWGMSNRGWSLARSRRRTSTSRSSSRTGDSDCGVTRRIPLGRRGVPQDVARWIVAFADPTAEWVTGQIITVDDGLELVDVDDAPAP